MGRGKIVDRKGRLVDSSVCTDCGEGFPTKPGKERCDRCQYLYRKERLRESARQRKAGGMKDETKPDRR